MNIEICQNVEKMVFREKRNGSVWIIILSSLVTIFSSLSLHMHQKLHRSNETNKSISKVIKEKM